MLPGAGTPRRRTFSYVFEQDPHGAVHGLIGGDMGFVPTSARDPIFWLHHANVDRLWTAWMKTGSPILPAASSPWGQASFKFDVPGNMTKQAGPLLDSQASLQYRYDNEAPPGAALVASAASAAPAVAAFAAEPPKIIEAPAATVDFGQMKGLAAGARPAQTTLSATRAPFKLGNSAIAVDLHIAPPSAAQLHSLMAQKPIDLKSAYLVLEDVELGGAGRQGGFGFKIVASLPEGAGGVRRAVIGTLNTFSLSVLAQSQGHGAALPGKQTLKFPLADILTELDVKSPDALAKGLRVTFEPVHSEEAGGEPDLVKIGAVKIVGSGAADQ
jgi:tyrosinase